MIRRQLFRTAAGLLAVALSLVGVQVVAAAPASAAARIVYYDVSRAGEFATNFDQAAAIWNSRVTNVQLQRGTPASVKIYVDSGWPRAYVYGLGSGVIYMGWQAVNQGYNRTRIASHELGHILGLPDNRTGLCSDLMSGSSAPVSCTNAYPSATEASRVNSLFGTSAFTGPVATGLHVD
ncbi:snapalysin family zinc-dependent metalloprotease [Micromonospora echinofusca]|uniref:Extracellular small neutral protease n=1 Tax=Micromonospora echinofusca TaxID=47858 RepID=A0ABS3W036_MICEH|nr:snapalysin family zinc-dependent metalloprotease [Micromonospora echinofusca]MBO4210129.1 snapalysin family zinc-dependent metalloprotease [Micromonospora echinofusca]